MRAAVGDVSKQNKTQATNQPEGSEGKPEVLFLHLLQQPQCSCCKMETRPPCSVHAPRELCCSEPKAMTHKGPPKTGMDGASSAVVLAILFIALLWSSAAPSLSPYAGVNSVSLACHENQRPQLYHPALIITS